MKVWLTGILFGGFFGFTIATMAFVLELLTYGKESKPPVLTAIQLLIILFFAWVAWKAEGVQTLVGYILGSFYILRLILLPRKTKID
ncbi:MAG: hypothetical protein R3297_05085 [Desulfobulbales bacterium]|nr:hypothetical protein [Desulfobulbales bacterium]